MHATANQPGDQSVQAGQPHGLRFGPCRDLSQQSRFASREHVIDAVPAITSLVVSVEPARIGREPDCLPQPKDERFKIDFANSAPFRE